MCFLFTFFSQDMDQKLNEIFIYFDVCMGNNDMAKTVRKRRKNAKVKSLALCLHQIIAEIVINPLKDILTLRFEDVFIEK